MTILDQMREILKRDHTSFAELERGIEGFSGGDMAVTHGDYPNIEFWRGLTREAVSAVNTILAEGEYGLLPCSRLVYLVDGITLGQPLAKSARNYKTPRWMPVVFKRVK